MNNHRAHPQSRTASVVGGILFACLLSACGGGEPATAPLPADPSAAGTTAGETLSQADQYRGYIQGWRSDRLRQLKAPDGWLSLVGLYWLNEGASTFGTDPGQDLVIPSAGAPPRVGTFIRQGGRVRFSAAEGAGVRRLGAPVGEVAMVSDAQGVATVLECGTLSWYLIQRGDKLGIRLKDSASPRIIQLRDIPAFPADPGWRVQATLERFPQPREIETPTVIGSVLKQQCPGILVFEAGGQTCRVQPVMEENGSLFLVFGDQTNGVETYGGGRFLEIPAPDAKGKTVVDFNKAYNPPCVFSPYATCPLPRAENVLPIRVIAGEHMVPGFH